MLLLLSVPLLGFLAYGQVQLQGATADLNALVAGFEGQTAACPVLRGSAAQGNAAALLLAAVSALPPIGEERRDAISEALFYGTALGAQGQVTQAEERVLTEIRMALQSRWTMTSLDVAQGFAVLVPDYPRVVDAALLHLLASRDASPVSCMQGAADVVRMGQVLVPGAPLEASSVSARLSAIALPVFARCAGNVDEAALLDGLRELRLLVRQAPAVTSGLELQRILLATELIKRAAPVEGQSALGWLLSTPARRDALSAAKQLLSSDAILPELRVYPGVLESLRMEELRQQQLGLHVGADRADQAVGFVYDDMRGQAMLRAGTVGLSTLVWFRRHGRLPQEPVGLHDPDLADPFTGRPLIYRFNEVEHTLVLWSVGEDLRDGGGSAQWKPEAPADVVFRLPLPNPEAQPTRSARRRRR